MKIAGGSAGSWSSRRLSPDAELRCSWLGEPDSVLAAEMLVSGKMDRDRLPDAAGCGAEPARDSSPERATVAVVVIPSRAATRPTATPGRHDTKTSGNGRLVITSRHHATAIESSRSIVVNELGPGDADIELQLGSRSTTEGSVSRAGEV